MTAMKTCQDKKCKTCGTVFNRMRMESGRLEDANVYSKRMHCSLSCANTREDVKAGTLLWRARKHKKDACEACGFTSRLQVHHCDQNQANNDPANLQTLCKHCHDFWHTTAKRLGRPVAGRMPCLGLHTESLTGWTALKPSGTVKFQPAPQPRGELLEGLEA